MPIRKIAVATDFGGPAEVAIQEALTLARHHDAELVLVHVAHPPKPPTALPPGLRYMADDYAQELKRAYVTSEQRLDEWLRSFPDAKVSHRSFAGHPVDELPKAAETLRADLLVLGTHGHTGIRRFLLGSVAERVVRLSEGYVMVARGSAKGDDGYQRILVPVDFSEYTEPAIEKAIEIAGRDSEIELCHFWQLPGVMSVQEASAEIWPQMRTGIIDVLAKQGDALVEKYSADHPGKLYFETREGKPAAGIQERIEDGKFDLVVMGSHGRRGLRRFALGSVAEVSVRHASCSILVSHKIRAQDDDRGYQGEPIPGL